MYKVLHVDSNAESMEATERLVDWAFWGFEIQARTALFDKAQALFGKQPFSLVLINMKADPCGALQLCGQIRQSSRVPIILLGGSQDFELARKALFHQVHGYLVEPLQQPELSASVQAVKRELDSRSFPASDGEPVPPENVRTKPTVIDMVKRFVQEELHQNVTLKKISDALHFNSAYLGQKFKHEAKMSFHEYLCQQRMERAKRLLEQTDMRIYEIACEVGYMETDWFYKKFKEYTGISANEYRKQLMIG